MIVVRPLARTEFEQVGARLPLHRFADWREDSTYLVAWESGASVGHAHIAWTGTELDVPELQDFYVLEAHRGQGIGGALARAAEELIASRGYAIASLSVSQSNPAARRLYKRLGYERADIPPQRVTGTVAIRGGSLEVDDTLLYFVKRLVDFPQGGSS